MLLYLAEAWDRWEGYEYFGIYSTPELAIAELDRQIAYDCFRQFYGYSVLTLDKQESLVYDESSYKGPIKVYEFVEPFDIPL